MSNRWAPRPRARWLIGAVAVVLLVIVWALLVPGADWLARHDVGSAKGSLATARDAARGRLLTLGAGLLATGTRKKSTAVTRLPPPGVLVTSARRCMISL